MKVKEYTYKVEGPDQDGEFIGTCAEYPSLSWLGATYLIASAGIRSLVQEVEEDIKNDNQE